MEEIFTKKKIQALSTLDVPVSFKERRLFLFQFFIQKNKIR